MPVPYTFGSATSAIPLSQLDSNFATTITLGNTAIQLGNTVTTLNNMTLANVTVSSVASAITVAQGGTGQTTLTTAYGVLCAGTTATGSVQTLSSLGSSGQVLTSNGAGALPSFQAIPSVSGASLVFIQRQTPSAAATCDFTTGIDSTYDEYLFIFTNVVPASNNDKLVCQYSTNAGSSWLSTAANYYSQGITCKSDVTNAADGYPGSVAYHVLGYVCSNGASDGGWSGSMNWHNPSNSSGAKQFNSSATGYYTASAVYWNSLFGGSHQSTSAFNGIRFKFVSGNITSGTIALYGVKKS